MFATAIFLNIHFDHMWCCPMDNMADVTCVNSHFKGYCGHKNPQSPIFLCKLLQNVIFVLFAEEAVNILQMGFILPRGNRHFRLPSSSTSM